MPFLAEGTLVAFGLYLVRTSAMVLAAPLLGSGARFPGYKIGLIGILSLLMFSVDGRPVPEAVEPLVFAAMALREVLIGLALAFVLEAVLLAVRVAGEILGHEMAFTISSQVDPVTGVNTALISRVYEGLFLIGLLAVNGHHHLLRALGSSFERAPVGALPGERSLPLVVEGLFVEMFSAGLTFAAPAMVLLMLVSILVGLLARAVPQLNILEISFSLRILVALFAMFLFAPLLEPAVDRLFGGLVTGLDGVLLALERD